MAIAALLIGSAPTYAVAGAAGPLLLICGRLLQGLSAGAEFGSAVAYLIEWAPEERRGGANPNEAESRRLMDGGLGGQR
jgi:MHS family proline/betaine transporter-like MFS transporter